MTSFEKEDYREQSKEEQRRAVLLISGYTSLMSFVDRMLPQTPPQVPSLGLSFASVDKLERSSIANAQAKRERRAAKRLGK